jgi:hypothetical protein
MLRERKPWSRAIAAAALACGCLSSLGANAVRAEEMLAEHSLAGLISTADAHSIPARFAIRNESAIEPTPTLATVNLPGLAGRPMLWDVAARASAANEPRFQRAFFLSAHMRF